MLCYCKIHVLLDVSITVAANEFEYNLDRLLSIRMDSCQLRVIIEILLELGLCLSTRYAGITGFETAIALVYKLIDEMNAIWILAFVMPHEVMTPEHNTMECFALHALGCSHASR